MSGLPQEVNAYQSELQGIHTILLALTCICKVFNITDGQVILACNNEVSMYHTNITTLDVPPSVNHANLM